MTKIKKIGLSAAMLAMMVVGSANISAEVISSSVIGSNLCSAWSPSSNTVNIGTTFKQDRVCSEGYESRYAKGSKQSWASEPSVNYDWTAVGEKYNCTTIAGVETCKVEQEKSTIAIQKDSLSGMKRIESVVKTSRVDNVSDLRSINAPTYTEPPEAADRVASTYETCNTTTSGWSPSTETVQQGTIFTQYRTVTETCTTYQSWTSGKTEAISTRSTSTQENQTAKGEACPYQKSNGIWVYCV